MKLFVTYIRYISLLLIGGLILTLYINSITPITTKAEKHVAEKNDLCSTHSKSPSITFSLLDDLLGALFPALKN
ncbi:MAG: hypothetical protein JWR23_3556 [Mucilaginibacter sp.]|nr:hypothetical protein [Mucilaginibacter sp.]